MAREPYLIAGQQIPLLEAIDLAPDEILTLERAGCVAISRPVAWPIASTVADLSQAYTDTGNTDIWGQGPYLKVPNRTACGDLLVNRVFCPWGYPPDRISATPVGAFVKIASVSLSRHGASWCWHIRLESIGDNET
jgi:hypothetical protein